MIFFPGRIISFKNTLRKQIINYICLLLAINPYSLFSQLNIAKKIKN